MAFRHYESNAIVPAQAERLFEFVDDHMSLSAHMGKPSWKMGWSSMEIIFDENRGRSIGSHICLTWRVLGTRLSVEEVVTERNPPRRTFGKPSVRRGYW